MTNYKAKKSNLNDLLAKNNMDLDTLEKSTNISKSQLESYTSKKSDEFKLSYVDL
ncbi:hypothetical protein JOC86_003123 [Bacillus pakistanensis]|uniref:Uncharacterized protein n=1 Tax=Rossellomorea pakistanensis TaxID=992288 RepID=A0ABS2NG69_9BACI|nr:hypothetical protein [Bacillus pakistanensis]